MIEVLSRANYIANAKLVIRFYIECRQWDDVNWSKVKSWVDNFPEDEDSQYLIFRLLKHILYYSEHDMLRMLNKGIFEKVFGSDVMKHQIESEFSVRQNDLQFYLNELISKTYFIPLLDQGETYESGNQIARLLVYKLGIPTERVTLNLNKLLQGSCNRLIIVDDCIGSGDQCRTFWSNTKIGNELLYEWCLKNNIQAYYVMLLGYKKNIEQLKKDLPQLNICCVEELEDEHRVFHDNSKYWDNESELLEARKFFSQMCDSYGIPLSGYNNLDFAAVLHYNIPDWSLPMFWCARNPDWKILLRRKNSDAC